MSEFREQWLQDNAVIPVDVETTGALMREIKRLHGIVDSITSAWHPVSENPTKTGWYITYVLWPEGDAHINRGHLDKFYYVTPDAPKKWFGEPGWTALNEFQRARMTHWAPMPDAPPGMNNEG